MSPFCPHCGSPQIYLQNYEQQNEGLEADTTGAIPPPRPQRVEWKTAIRCAATVAGVAAGLSLVSQRVQVVSLLSLFWTISGSMITLALYQRRRPLAWMDAGIGARIGLVVGLALVAWLWFSPEFRAGLMLTGFGMVSGILLFLSTVGGAVGGFVRMRRNASA